MPEGHLLEFAVLLAVLGGAAALALSVRLPVVPVYIAAGVALGGFLAPDETVRFLGSLGVVFLLFSMGLEFSVSGFTREPRRFLTAGSIDLALNFPIGLVAGLALGWSWQESLFLAGIVYMSSSSVVAKCISDFGRAARPETETVLRIMVFEDLVIAVYLVVLTTLVAGTAAGVAGYAQALGGAALFVAALLFAAHRYQEPLARMIAHRSEEAFTLALFAFVIAISALAGVFRLSEAVGAFLAGLVIGSTHLKARAAQTLLPFQTLFAALFFISFGMSLDLGRVAGVAVPGVVLIALGVATKTLGGFLAGRAAGHPTGLAAVVGLSLVPKGEFSVVIAGLAAAASRPDSHIVALTGLYVFGLSIIGPIGMREADRVAGWLIQPRSAD